MVINRQIKNRRRIFVGVEGKSEKSFVAWIQNLCDEAELRVHLDIWVAGGGDTKNILNLSIKRMNRLKEDKGNFDAALILIDHDRLENDLATDQDLAALIKSKDIEIIWQKPNLEGVLFRLHEGNENRIVTATDAKGKLIKLWPDYSKKVTVVDIEKRFSVHDLKRAPKFDKQLQNIVSILNL